MYRLRYGVPFLFAPYKPKPHTNRLRTVRMFMATYFLFLICKAFDLLYLAPPLTLAYTHTVDVCAVQSVPTLSPSNAATHTFVYFRWTIALCRYFILLSALGVPLRHSLPNRHTHSIDTKVASEIWTVWEMCMRYARNGYIKFSWDMIFFFFVRCCFSFLYSSVPVYLCVSMRPVPDGISFVFEAWRQIESRSKKHFVSVCT